jgi:hypothetical protein
MGSKSKQEKVADYAAKAELKCSACEGTIIIGIPRDKIKATENLEEMPSMEDPRWEVVLISCGCVDD